MDTSPTTRAIVTLVIASYNNAQWPDSNNKNKSDGRMMLHWLPMCTCVGGISLFIIMDLCSYVILFAESVSM